MRPFDREEIRTVSQILREQREESLLVERDSLEDETQKGAEISEESDIKNQSVEDITQNLDESPSKSSEIPTEEISPTSTPRKRAAKTLLDTEISPRRVSPRQHASSKFVLQATPTRSSVRTRAHLTVPDETRSQSSLPEEDTPRRMMTRSRKGSVSSVESESTVISSPSVRRTRRVSVSQESEKSVSQEQAEGDRTVSREPSVDSVAAGQQELLEPSESKAKDIPSTPVRRSRRLSTSQDADNPPSSVTRSLRSASVTSLSSQVRILNIHCF